MTKFRRGEETCHSIPRAAFPKHPGIDEGGRLETSKIGNRSLLPFRAGLFSRYHLLTVYELGWLIYFGGLAFLIRSCFSFIMRRSSSLAEMSQTNPARLTSSKTIPVARRPPFQRKTIIAERMPVMKKHGSNGPTTNDRTHHMITMKATKCLKSTFLVMENVELRCLYSHSILE